MSIIRGRIHFSDNFTIMSNSWARALEITRRQVTSPEVLVGELLDADLVPMALAKHDNAGVIDLARQFAHSATGAGRNDTFRALPGAALYYASELLDGSGCGPCSRIDGEEWDNLPEALQFYGSGVYRGCEGSFRCRGVLVRVPRG